MNEYHHRSQGQQAVLSHVPLPLAKRLLFVAFTFLVCIPVLNAETGIVVYGSKGTDQRRTDSGHIALIVTDLCAAGINQVRRCEPSEAAGVVITAYANLASDYDKAVIVLPLLDHFEGTHDRDHIPVLSSGASLRSAQIKYWREHLRTYIPPMTQARYTELRADLERFDAGRTVRRFLTMEFLSTLLGGHKHQDATEPIALVDPETQELIPEGRWREAVGTEHTRSSVVITAPASIDQELRLTNYLDHPPFASFNAMSANCSDFVERALLAVYGDHGLRFRPRQVDLADAWITSPIFVATGFLSYLKHNDVAPHVAFMPIIAGTRRSHFSVHSISRGALVPDAGQGKLAMSLKIYFNFLNPLLGVTSFTVDQLSRLSDLPGLVHDCGAGDLLASGAEQHPCWGFQTQARDRVRVFGTPACWKRKESAFQAVASQAVEVGLLESESKHLILRRGQPFLFARLYEHPASDPKRNQPLLTGMFGCTEVGCQAGATSTGASLEDTLQPLAPDAKDTIPSRPDVLVLADSPKPLARQVAFKLMASVINYDLSSEPGDRRSVQDFDRDWKLLIHVAAKNNLTVPAENRSESLEHCSCQSFDLGTESLDAVQVARGFGHTIARVERELVYGPSR